MVWKCSLGNQKLSDDDKYVCDQIGFNMEIFDEVIWLEIY